MCPVNPSDVSAGKIVRFCLVCSLSKLKGVRSNQPRAAVAALVCPFSAPGACAVVCLLTHPLTLNPAGNMACYLVNSRAAQQAWPQGVTAEIPSPLWNLLPPPGGDTYDWEATARFLPGCVCVRRWRRWWRRRLTRGSVSRRLADARILNE